ncbi:MAG: RHS repeat-associated core domain-containing protein [Verrucomicrobiales bacterium]
MSSALGLANTALQINGSWSTDYNENGYASYTYDADFDGELYYTRAAYVIALPEFEELDLRSADYIQDVSTRGEVSVDMREMCCVIDLGVGIAPQGAEVGYLAVPYPFVDPENTEVELIPAAPVLVGCLNDFQISYADPPDPIIPKEILEGPESEIPPSMVEDCTDAGWSSVAQYRDAWDRMRIVEVKSRHLTAEIEHKTDYSKVVRLYENDTWQLIKTVEIYNPSVGGPDTLAFPPDPKQLIVREIGDSVEPKEHYLRWDDGEKRWILDVSGSSGAIWRKILKDPRTDDPPALYGCYHELIYQGGTESNHLLSSRHIDYFTWAWAQHPLPREIIEHAVDDPARDRTTTFEFNANPANANAGTAAIDDYSLARIDCQGFGWEWDGAAIEFEDYYEPKTLLKHHNNGDGQSASSLVEWHREGNVIRRDTSVSGVRWQRWERSYQDAATFVDSMGEPGITIEAASPSLQTVAYGKNYPGDAPLDSAGRMPWLPQSVHNIDGHLTFWTYFNSANRQRVTKSGTSSAAPGPVEVPSFLNGVVHKEFTNAKGDFDHEQLVNLDGGAILYEAEGEDDNLFGQPQQINFQDGSDATFEYFESGALAGLLKEGSSRRNQQFSIVRNVLGDATSGSFGGITFAATSAGLSRSLTQNAGSRSIHESRTLTSLGELNSFSTNLGPDLNGSVLVRGPNYNSYWLTSEGRQQSKMFAANNLPLDIEAAFGQRGSRMIYGAETVNSTPCLTLRYEQEATGNQATGSRQTDYYDPWGRLKKRVLPHPNGSGDVEYNYSYNMAARQMTITPPSPSPPTTIQYNAAWTTATIISGEQEIQVSNYLTGNEWIKEIKIRDDSGGGASPLLSLGIERTRADGANIVSKPWGQQAWATQVAIGIPAANGTVPGTITGPDGSSGTFVREGGALKTLAFSAFGGTTLTTVDLDGFKLPMSTTTTQPGIADPTIVNYDADYKISSVNAPGYSATVTYDHPGQGERVTINSAQYPTSIYQQAADGDPLRTQVYGGDDADFGVRHSSTGDTLDLEPDGASATEFRLGPQGHLLEKTYAGGSDVTITRLANGAPASVTYQVGTGTQVSAILAYEANGLLDTISWADAAITNIDYFEAGLPSAISDPSGSRAFTWDHLQLATETHSSGVLSGLQVTRKYDSRHRFAGTKVTSGGSVLHETTVIYRGDGLVDYITSADSRSTYVYKSGTPAVESVTRRDAVSTANSLVSTTGYDNRMRIEFYQTPTNSGTITVLTDYNARGHRWHESVTTGLNWTYTYDSDGRLATAAGSGGVPSLQGWEFDAIGNPIGSGFGLPNILNQLTSRNNPQTYGISGKVAPGTLLSAWRGASEVPDTVVPDVAGWFWGQWTSTGNTATWRRIPIKLEGRLTAAGDDGTDAVALAETHALVPPQTTSFDYDAAGNLRQDARWTYAWDVRGKLSGMTRRAELVAAGENPLELAFVYDAGDRRVWKRVLETIPGSGGGPSTVKETITRVLLDGWLPVMEETVVNAGAPRRRFFTWGLDVVNSLRGAGGVGALLAVYDEPSEKTFFPVYDGRGNVIALVDKDTKSIVAQWVYDPWGRLLQESDPQKLGAFGFSTKYRDTETGLIYFGYRYYDPNTGRWLSRDPLGEAGGFNLYAYCHNDPVNRVDPLGLATILSIDNGPFFFTGLPHSGSESLGSQFAAFGDNVSWVDSMSIIGMSSPILILESFPPRLPDPPSGFNPFASEIGNILAELSADIYNRMPRFHETGWFLKPFFASYDDSASLSKANSAFGALLDREGVTGDAREEAESNVSAAIRQLTLMPQRRHADLNTWEASGVELSESALWAIATVASEGLSTALGPALPTAKMARVMRLNKAAKEATLALPAPRIGSFDPHLPGGIMTSFDIGEGGLLLPAGRAHGANPAGSFLSANPIPNQAYVRGPLATIPEWNPATNVSDAFIPPGVRLQMSIANPHPSLPGSGYGIQLQILNDADKARIIYSNTRPLQ